MQIGTAGKGGLDGNAVSPHRAGERGGGFVFRNVAGLEPRHDDLGDSGRRKGGDVGCGNDRALAHDFRAGAHRMRRDRALRLGDRNRAEFHGLASGPRRRRSVISARIATAISAGLAAPIGSPIGA